MGWQLWTRPFGSYVFLWMILALLALTSLLAAGAATSRDRDQWVAHSLEILHNIERYESGLLQAELRSRRALDPAASTSAGSLAGLDEAHDAITQLARLAADDPRQAIRVKVLQNLTVQVSGGIRARMQSDVVPLIDSPLIASPISALPILETVNEIRTAETLLLLQRQQAQVRADAAFFNMTCIAIALHLLFIWWAYRASRRYIAERNQREAQIESLNQTLGSQMEEIRLLNTSLEDRIHDKTAELEMIVAKLRSSNAELVRFAYVASHDLQEPLRQVASFSELITIKYGDQLDATARRYLSHSVAGAKRLQLMLQGLLRYSVVSITSLNMLSIDPLQLVEGVRADLEEDISQSGTVFDLHSQDQMMISGDVDMIRSVLSTLVSNSIRFQRKGIPPRVSIAFERDPTHWTMTVADNGIGLDQRFIERMFNMFARYHSVGEYDGAGAGLAISKKIVELHGGTLTASVNPQGQGALLKVVVPMVVNGNAALRTRPFPY